MTNAPRDVRDRLEEFYRRIALSYEPGSPLWRDLPETERAAWRRVAAFRARRFARSCGLKIVPDDGEQAP